MLEDVRDDASLIERVLKKGNISFTPLIVNSAEKFIEAIDQFHPDVILSDHALPQFNSIEALKLCRDRGLTIPFILVTGTVSEEFAVNCLKMGVDDYILKGNLSRLPAAIVNVIKQREIQSKNLIAEKKLREQNLELLSANEQLSKTNMELDNFVYSVSHNLRGPLASVLGLINILQMENRKKGIPANDVFNMIETSITRLDETMKEILDYSRNARMKPMIQLVNIKAVFNACIEKLKYEPHFNRIIKHCIIETRKPFYSDVYRISVIFQNLISNAIRYQDPGKEKSYLQVKGSASDTEISIVFSDNGIGISKDQIPFVFNMFHRSTERSNGAGLGLYIVKEAVEKLNGKIKLETQLGEGATFKITLPNIPPSPKKN